MWALRNSFIFLNGSCLDNILVKIICCCGMLCVPKHLKKKTNICVSFSWIINVQKKWEEFVLFV